MTRMRATLARGFVALALVVLHDAWVSAQPTGAAAAFRIERPVVTRGSGPRRLAVDVPLLSGTNPGLPDLRLFDGAGREVPYLLVANPPAAPAWATGTLLPVASVDTEKLKTSGFETDLGELRLIDRFRITMPPVASFLKRVRLEGSGDRQHWTLLVGEGTLFDLHEERLRNVELLFTPGSYRYLRLTWDDTSSGRLGSPLSAEARLVTQAPPPPALTAPLAVEKRPGEPGKSHYRLRLPAAKLPVVALAFDVGDPRVLRNASVYESRFSGTELAPVLLGATTLQRVVQGALTASSLELRMTPPSEPQLDLVVDDGDNAPLDIRSVSAVFAEQPWIYFEGGDGTVVARYGNATLGVPRYDLEAMRDTLRVSIRDVADAAWGEPQLRAPEDQPAAPARAMPTVGASIDPARFTYLRDLPAGDAGLMRLSLDAAVLAHSGGTTHGFRDVRVIDGDGHQVPYLVERGSEPLSLEVALRQEQQLPKGLPGHLAKPTLYRVTLPFGDLPSSRLVLSTSARVFRRAVSVGIEREPDRSHRDSWIEVGTRVSWTHADEGAPAPSVSLAVPKTEAKGLLVMVEEGDNAPLPIASARILLPSYHLRFFRERGTSLRLAYGREDLAPPTYDLALLAPQVLGVTATEIEAAAEPAGRSTEVPTVVSPRLFCGVLVVAVVALLGLIGRLLRRDVPAT